MNELEKTLIAEMEKSDAEFPKAQSPPMYSIGVLMNLLSEDKEVTQQIVDHLVERGILKKTHESWKNGYGESFQSWFYSRTDWKQT
jgi:hypothetical protein